VANGEPTKAGQVVQNTILGILAVAFTAWSGVVWQASRDIAERLDTMNSRLQAYQVENERRITTVEQQVNWAEECCARLLERVQR
jgi:hypothetical protein